ncbi:MAG: putative immunity protein [Specibacter sp.]
MPPLFELQRADGSGTRDAIARGRAWTRAEVLMSAARQMGLQANEAGRGVPDPVKFAALAAGQAVAVAHVAAHDLGCCSLCHPGGGCQSPR